MIQVHKNYLKSIFLEFLSKFVECKRMNVFSHLELQSALFINKALPIIQDRIKTF